MLSFCVGFAQPCLYRLTRQFLIPPQKYLFDSLPFPLLFEAAGVCNDLRRLECIVLACNAECSDRVISARLSGALLSGFSSI